MIIFTTKCHVFPNICIALYSYLFSLSSLYRSDWATGFTVSKTCYPYSIGIWVQIFLKKVFSGEWMAFPFLSKWSPAWQTGRESTVLPGKGQWPSANSDGRSQPLHVFQAPSHLCSTKQVNKKYTGLILSEFMSEQVISPSIFAMVLVTVP